jgi:predicted amidophosphoribosyltransferase
MHLAPVHATRSVPSRRLRRRNLVRRVLERCLTPLAWLGEQLYGRTCAGCETLLSGLRDASRGLCEVCVEALVDTDGLACPRCAALDLDQPPSRSPRPCAACRRVAPAWDHVTALLAWGGPLRDAVTTWKNRPAFHLSRPLGDLFVELAAGRGVMEQDADLIVPIPSPRARLSERGFNPAGILAESLAVGWERRCGGAPALAPEALDLAPSRLAASSRGAGRAARAARVAGAFRARPDVSRGARVLIIDDVMTTGATLTAATEALLAAGASAVSACVLARVPERHHRSLPLVLPSTHGIEASSAWTALS